ncbi:TrmH family RNA methyltransferase [Rubrivirga sp. IMCC43871]|uniref:TrmH family RNA methyltransferase n=1 Tax=Rubrivirga sp. IMCC43871 TaxID=3391575 RepID=UPI00399009F9
MTRQQLKDAAALARSKGRRAQGRFLVEGVRSVEAAVAAGAPLVAVLATEAALASDRVAALADRVVVTPVPTRDLERVGDARSSQGVLAIAESVTTDAVPETPGPVLLLDGVQDPGNVGALVRTAAWFGVGTVVADTDSADFESPKAVRASMGGIWDVSLVRVPLLAPVLDALINAGADCWGADLGGTPVGAWAPGASSALVMGSEAHGLSEEVAARVRSSGGLVHIGRPGAGAGVESLNVAVAGGVLLARWLGR